MHETFCKNNVGKACLSLFDSISNNKNLLDSNGYDFEALNSFLINVLIIFVVMISLVEINRGDMQISSMIALNILLFLPIPMCNTALES